MTDITGFKQDIVSSYIPKDPDSQLTYTVDWTDWMPTGSTLSTVAVAISTGGPGACFWMVLLGILGMATKFAECTLV